MGQSVFHTESVVCDNERKKRISKNLVKEKFYKRGAFYLPALTYSSKSLIDDLSLN